MWQLMQAISWVHQHNIIHRDVKVANTLWDNEMQHLFLFDFDVAIIHKPGQIYCHVRGTDGYIAPEIMDIEDNPKRALEQSYDYKVDIYSAGVVFGQLLYDVKEHDLSNEETDANSGPGFRRKARKQLKRLRQRQRFKNVDLGERHDLELLAQMLHPDPKERPNAEQVLKSKYFDALSVK